jgi:glycine reductase
VSRILEGEGIPVAMISAIPLVPEMMGVPRIVPGYSITSVVGNPNFPPSQEKALRRRIVVKALEALETEVTAPTTFSIY